MKLHYAPFTRATRPRWLLEEMGVPYELVRVDLAAKQHKSAAHLEKHPHGAVPVLEDGDLVLIESAAICAYIAEKHPEKGFGPKDAAERGRFYQWLFYAMATLEPPALSAWGAKKQETDEQKRAFAEAKPKLDVCFAFLEKSLAGREHFLGRMTAVDCVLGSILALAQPLLDPYPALKAYTARMKERPAFKRARAD